LWRRQPKLAGPFFWFETSQTVARESGKPACGFPLFRALVGAEGMWKSRRCCEISKDLWELVESLPSAFHSFHQVRHFLGSLSHLLD